MLPVLILAKLREQVDRADHLLSLVPAGSLEWKPDAPTTSGRPPAVVGRVIGHLLECLAGSCAALYAANSDRLGHFLLLRQRPVNHSAQPEEARERIREYMRHIEEGFALLSNADLERVVPTVFVPSGEALITLLLGNLEHLINHKYQLFFYLKLLGVPVGSRDLYCWRGEAQ